MALDPTALLTLPEAKLALQLVDSSEDATVETAIHIATALAENVYCGRPLKARAITALIEGPCRGQRLEIYPPLAWPIDLTAPVGVVVNDTVQTVWRSPLDGPIGDMDVIARPDHFYRSAGWAPTGVPYNVALTYTGGLNPVPAELREAATEVVLKVWGPMRRGVLDVATLSSGGTSITNLESFGVSSGFSLTRRSLEVFQQYRVRRVG